MELRIFCEEPLPVGLFVIDQIIDSRKAVVQKRIIIITEGIPVKLIEGLCSCDDVVILLMHIKKSCYLRVSAGFASGGDHARFLYLADGMPDLYDSQFFFVMEHARGRPVGVEHTYSRCGHMSHAPKGVHRKGEICSHPFADAVADVDKTKTILSPRELLLYERKIKRQRAALPAAEDDLIVFYREELQHCVNQRQSSLHQSYCNSHFQCLPLVFTFVEIDCFLNRSVEFHGALFEHDASGAELLRRFQRMCYEQERNILMMHDVPHLVCALLPEVFISDAQRLIDNHNLRIDVHIDRKTETRLHTAGSL